MNLLSRTGRTTFERLARGTATLPAILFIATATLAVFGSPPAAAQSASDIVGGWYLQSSPTGTVSGTLGVLQITFTSDGTFYTVQDEGCCGSGVEYGTYAWNPTTGALAYTASVNTDGDLGLADSGLGSYSTKAVVNGNTLTFSHGFAMTRVTSATSPIVGSWYAASGPANDDRVFTFLSDGTYLSAGNENPARDPTVAKGIERGAYTWNAGSGAFTHTVTVNTDGEGGLSSAICNKALVSGNTLTLTCADKSKPTVFGSFSTTRIASAAATGAPAPLDPTKTVSPPPVTQAAYTAPGGQLPEAAVQVSATGTFGRASLRVVLELPAVPTTGFAAVTTYNVYVAALVPGAVLGSASPMIFVKAKTGGWGPLTSPIAAFLENVAQTAVANRVTIDILADTDISSLPGTEIYIGYGTDDQEMLRAGRYRGVYKVQ